MSEKSTPAADAEPARSTAPNERQQGLRQRVREACAELAAADQRVSTRAVRNTIGGGNPNEINPWVAEWKQQQENEQRQRAAIEALPDAVRDRINERLQSVVNQLWADAQTVASEQTRRLQASAQAERSEWTAQMRDLQALIDDLQNENDALRSERDALELRLQRADSALDVANARLDDARQTRQQAERELVRTRDALTASRSTAEHRATQLAEQARSVDALRTRCELDRAACAKANEKIVALETQRGQLRAQLDHCLQDGAQLREHIAAGNAERDRARVDLHTANERHQKEIADLKETVVALQGRLLSQQQLRELLKTAGADARAGDAAGRRRPPERTRQRARPGHDQGVPRRGADGAGRTHRRCAAVR